jgi:hypothetical protein
MFYISIFKNKTEGKHFSNGPQGQTISKGNQMPKYVDFLLEANSEVGF